MILYTDQFIKKRNPPIKKTINIPRGVVVRVKNSAVVWSMDSILILLRPWAAVNYFHWNLHMGGGLGMRPIAVSFPNIIIRPSQNIYSELCQWDQFIAIDQYYIILQYIVTNHYSVNVNGEDSNKWE